MLNRLEINISAFMDDDRLVRMFFNNQLYLLYKADEVNYFIQFNREYTLVCANANYKVNAETPIQAYYYKDGRKVISLRTIISKQDNKINSVELHKSYARQLLDIIDFYQKERTQNAESN